MYDEKLQEYRNTVESCTSLALTTDFWTSNNNESYCGITGHWIDCDWKLTSVTLGCLHVEERHTAANVASLFHICRASAPSPIYLYDPYLEGPVGILAQRLACKILVCHLNVLSPTMSPKCLSPKRLVAEPCRPSACRLNVLSPKRLSPKWFVAQTSIDHNL